jgi:hypothetical protein
VKHGVKLQVVNLCTDEAGNRALPAKIRAQVLWPPPRLRQQSKRRGHAES